MEYSIFLDNLRRAGLTIAEFADLLRMNKTSIANYGLIGEVSAHLSVISALVAQMHENGLDFKSTIRKIELKKSKPRGVVTANFKRPTKPD